MPRAALWPLLPLLLPILLLPMPAGAARKNAEIWDLSLAELLATTFETASKAEEKTADAPSVSTVISAEEIQRWGANSLLEVLERAMSVYMTGSNFFPQNVLSMRGDLLGHYDNHILLLVNGRPLRESYAGGVNFAIYTAFPVSALTRIEIIRGPGSVLYGSNAYAGVVNLITRTDEERGRLSVGAGSFQGRQLSLSGASQADDWSLQWGAQLFREDGWSFRARDNDGLAGQLDAGEANQGLYLGGSYGRLNFNALYLDSRQDFIGASASWRGAPPVPQRVMASQRLFLDLGYSQPLNRDWSLDANLSYGEMDFDHYNYRAHSEDLCAELTGHWQPSSQWHWLLGATAWHQEVGSAAGLAAAPVAPFAADWYGLYSQLAYRPSEALRLIGGLQWNKAGQLDADLVGRYGLIYQFTPSAGVKLMHAQAYRAAFGVETGFELILRDEDGSVRGGLRGNPALAPERVATTDLQLFFNQTRYQLAATLFHSRLTDLITRERAADNVLDFVNKGGLNSRGLELEAKLNLNERLHLMASYSHQVNETDTGIDNYTTVPNELLKLGAIYEFAPGVTLGLYDNYVGEATDIAVQNPARNAYNPDARAHHLMTLNLQWRLARLLALDRDVGPSLNLYVYNLLDEDIHQPDFIGKRINTLPARSGRAVYVSLSFDFY